MAGLGARLTDGLWAETAVSYHSAQLSTRRMAIWRSAPDTSVSEGLQQYQMEVGGMWIPDALQLGRHAQMFAVGGGGYLRQLHGGGLLAETGHSLYAGGGVMVWLPRRKGASLKASGLRLEGRAVMLDGGVAFHDDIYAAPALSALLFLGF